MELETKPRRNVALWIVMGILILLLLWQGWEWFLVAHEIQYDSSTISNPGEMCPIRQVEVFGKRYFIFHKSYFIPRLLSQ